MSTSDKFELNACLITGVLMCISQHCILKNMDMLPGRVYTRIYIQGVPGGKDLTSGECSLGQTIPI